MKTEREVEGALASHQLTRKKLLMKTKLEETAKNLRWPEQYVLGYMEGIEFAYKWVLYQ